MHSLDAGPPAQPTQSAVSIAGQVTLVTGGAIRLGAAIVRELSAAGAQVVIHCHRSLHEAIALAATLPIEPLIVQADLRSPDQTREMFVRIVAERGRIDGLVNSAGIFVRAPLIDLDDQTWEDIFSLNLTAPQRCIRMALPLGLSSVVNIVDVAAWQPWRGYAAYASAKAGLLQLTRVLARELAPTVRVNALAPGPILFPENFSQTDREVILSRVPLQSSGHPADVGRAVRFLLEERYLTGVCLPVDGGAGLR